jgi:hypothetical protein
MTSTKCDHWFVGESATCRKCGAPKPPVDAAHDISVVPQGDGTYLVTCSKQCNLGDSAHAANAEDAGKRAELHRLATAPLRGQ